MHAALLMIGASLLAPVPDSQVATTPPMGWNSWDSYGASVREDEIKANAAVMATKLRHVGWKYVVVDIQWSEPTADGSAYHAGAPLEMDKYGRLTPAVNRFPSAADGKGFAPLAKWVHAQKLKFGIHVMRGIPRQAVSQNTPVLGTKLHAKDVADTTSTCPWNTDMYGVDPTKPGAQAYYDSLIKLYKSWGVDFLKIDDLSRPYHKGEIELIRSALDRIAPKIVLSTSPGETPVAEAEHVKTHANMWRIADDFWDQWPELLHMYDLCSKWQGHAGPGHWPDCDMLPIGHIGFRNGDRGGNRQTRFTKDEQVFMMSLFAIVRSPLMMGGLLTDLDPWTESLLTNKGMLEVLNKSTHNRQLSRDSNGAVWVANGVGKTYVAFLNVSGDSRTMSLNLSEVGLTKAKVHDLWSNKTLMGAKGELILEVPSHGARLISLTSAK